MLRRLIDEVAKIPLIRTREHAHRSSEILSASSPCVVFTEITREKFKLELTFRK